MQYLTLITDNFLLLLNAMAVYILIGLFFAGVLKQLIPNDFITKHLGKGSISSVIKATIFGIPLPVCSCSVIPLAQSLRKEGASKGSVQSFLISTPITGVDSILATYSFFGLIFTIFRVISSIIIAITVGIVQNLIQKENQQKIFFKEEENSSCCTSNTCCSSSTKEKKSFSLKAVLTYAYVTLFKDMVKPLFLGLILGALFTSFAPKEYTSILFENQFLTYIVIILLSMPLYVCATASLPLAAAFIMQGMSGGAAFIFLTAGPATSIITMSVVYKMLGKKSLFIYLITICILSLLFGYLYDTIFSSLNILHFTKEEGHFSLFSQIMSLLMLILMAYYLISPLFSKKEKSSCCN